MIIKQFTVIAYIPWIINLGTGLCAHTDIWTAMRGRGGTCREVGYIYLDPAGGRDFVEPICEFYFGKD